MTISGICKALLVACVASSLATTLVNAQEADSAAGDQWQFALPIYMWGADVNAKTQSGQVVEAEFGDLVDKLELGFMGAFEARKGKWSAMADIIYLNLNNDDTINLPLPPGPGGIGDNVTANATLDLTAWVFQAAGGYTLLTDGKSKLDLILGARYLDLDTDLSLDIQALGPGRSQGVSETDGFLDGIVGVKGNLALGKRWYLPYYLDIGTGQSDFTWQALGGVSFRAAEWIDVALVYRYLEWQFEAGKKLDDLSFSGPALGAIFRF